MSAANESAAARKAAERNADKARENKLDRKVEFEFEGESYTADVRTLTDLRFMRVLRDGDLVGATEHLVGETEAERVFESVADEDGYQDATKLSGLFEAVAEAAKDKGLNLPN